MVKPFAEVNQGLRTGSDKVTPKHISENNLDFKKGEGIFIISENELAGLDLTTKEFDYIKPLFKNSDISKYYTNTTTKYNLIDLFFPNDKDVDLDKIPNILSHLSKYKKILENRKENANGIDKQIKKGNYYFASVRRKLDFDQEKIVAPQRSRTNTFGYNNTPWYASADVYFITQPKDKYSLKFILGVLNSHTVFLWLFNRGKRKGEMLELYQEPLSVIPIPIITDVNKNIVKEVEVCVNDILNKKKLDKNANIKEFEQKIDELVMDLYGLNDDEKEIMRNSTK
jgi:adenine-specific DNA-methyltransferase